MVLLPSLLIVTQEGTLVREPEKVLRQRLLRKGNRDGLEVLGHWKGTIEMDTTWKDLETLKRCYLDLVG